MQRWLHNQRGLPPGLSLLVRCTTQTYLESFCAMFATNVACRRSIRCSALLCAAPHKPIKKLLRNARLVHNTSHRAGSASANGASVRCMDAAWRGAEGSSTQQPKLYDCRRSSTCSDGFTTNVACCRSFRCACDMKASAAIVEPRLLRG